MNNDKPTLLILTPGFASGETDSTCLPAHQSFARALKRNFPGMEITILAFHYPFVKSRYHWHGIEIISLHGKKKRKLKKLFFWRSVFNTLKKIKHEKKLIGILSFWCGECAWIGKRFAKKAALPHFCWIRGQDARKGNTYIKWIRPAATELIALSDSLQSEFEKNFHIRPAHVIGPGIDRALFTNDQQLRDIDIIGAGSLIPLKQFDIFLDIISEIKKQFPRIKAILCGHGPEAGNLQSQIEKLQLQENVEWKGELPYPDVLQLMQRSKILLHPSSYEGFSAVCQEALYAGAQVISFCRAMNRDIPHWHIVNSKNEMQETALAILQSAKIDHTRVVIEDIDETAKKIMRLFDY